MCQRRSVAWGEFARPCACRDLGEFFEIPAFAGMSDDGEQP